MIDLKNIIINTPSEKLENIISPFIEDQFPSFMKKDYRKLIFFVKAYYEWMEQQGNPGYVLSKLDTIHDVDNSLEEFYSHFKNTYLEGFPETLATNTSGDKPNKKNLLKQIRDFYGNKGTENAYRFLFRVLYDSDVEFYYPKEDILKTSDGRWIENISIKTTSINGSVLFSAKSTTMYQYDGANNIIASAEVDDVVQYNQDGYIVSEFFLKNLVGNFISSNPVTFTINNNEYKETIYNVLSEFYIQTPGSGFRVGDKATITDLNGFGFSAFISQTGLAGSIKKIGIKNSGINYASTVSLSFISETGILSSAIVFASPSAITRYPGYYQNNSGKLSSTKKIQDGHYYQDFSYQLNTAVGHDTYHAILSELIHPAGMRMFGSVLVNASNDSVSNTSTQATTINGTRIGKYTPYTHGTTIDLRANGATVGTVGAWLVNYGGVTYGTTGDLYPVGYNPYVGSTTEVGPDGKTAPSGTRFLGAGSYENLSVPEISLAGTTASFQKMQSFTVNSGYGANFLFSAYISSGAKYWAYRIRRTRNSVVSTVTSGTTLYTSNLDSSNTYSAHEYRLFRVPIADMQIGDTYDLEMVASTAAGTPQASTTQTLYAKNFRADSGMSNYCVMVENGTTAHSPLGAPLGSSAAFYRNAESNLDPSTIKGMQLWLKPENLTAIGGGSAAGASLAVWTDASPMANHGVLPTWDRWNEAVVYMKSNSISGITWDKIMWHPDPVDVVEWRCGIYGPPVSGVNFYAGDPTVVQVGGFWCGGTTAGNTSDHSGGENNGLGVTQDKSYANLQFGWYVYTNYTTPYSSQPITMTYAIPDGVSTSVVATLPATFTQSTVFGVCYDYENRNINSYVDGVVYRKTGPYPEGSTFSFELVPFGASAEAEVLRASYQGTQLSSTGWTCSAGLTFFTPLGKTMEFLAPTISKNNKGITGRDGLSFDGLVIYGPYSVWGYSGGSERLRELPALPFVPGGFSAEQLLKGKHFYLSRGLTLTNEMDAFMVFHSDSDYYGYGLGLAASNLVYAKDTTNIIDDMVFFNRSWNPADLVPGNQNTSYYRETTLANGATALGYGTYSASMAGLAGFRPAGSSATATQKIVVYDPHVSGVCMGTCVAEWTRDSGNMVQSFYNGDESKNYSPTTGRYTVGTDGRVISPGFTTDTPIGLGRFGVIKRTHISPKEVGHNWLNPTLTWAGDGSTFSASGVGLGGVTLYAQMYRGTPTYKIVAGTNAYLQSNNDWSATETSAVWTFSAYLKRSDSGAIGPTGVYLYHNGSTSYSTAGTVVSVGDGWYNISGSTSGAIGSISLVGFNGLSAGITYSIGGAVLEKSASPAPVGSSTWCDSLAAATPYGFNGVINEVLIWDRKLNAVERQQVYSYLSRKYQLDKALPTTFVGTHPSAPAGTTYWEIAHHPNSTQLVTAPAIYANTATLVDPRVWTVGSGFIGSTFGVVGNTASENNRVLGLDPWNKAAIVWQATSDGLTAYVAPPTTGMDGGWITPSIPIDRTKLYRFSVWVRRTVVGAGSGSFYQGIQSSVNNFSYIAGNNNGSSNAYTNYISVNGANAGITLQKDVWYLAVGHVYPSGTTQPANPTLQSSRHPNSGFWTVEGGSTTRAPGLEYGADWAWNTNDTNVRHRLFLYGLSSGGAGLADTTTLQFVYPRVEACDGTEPSLADLLQGYPVLGNIIPTGINFGNIQVRDFMNMPTSTYKSANTRLLGGTVLTGDTYDYA